MAENFSYDNVTVENIISKVNFSRDFLQVSTHELRTRDYERLMRKMISTELHCTTLAEYFKCSRIPRGLRSNLRPTLFSDDQEFCDRFEGIINKCSFDIMILTIQYLQKSTEEITSKIKAVEDQLSTTLPDDEWTKLRDNIKKSMEDFRKNTEIRKRQKFVRDTEDYQLKRVYKWQETTIQRQFGHNRDRFGYNTHDYNSSSSGSEGSAYSYRSQYQRFLGRGRRANRNRRRQGEAGGPVNPETQGIQTRSQVKPRV